MIIMCLICLFIFGNYICFTCYLPLRYPYLAHAMFGLSEQVGIFLGLSIHDTSQVMAAALTYREAFDDEVALKTAAVTKLTRNVFLATVIPALAWHSRTTTTASSSSSSSSSSSEKQGSCKTAAAGFTLSTLKKCLPLFVLGFIATACVRSFGDSMLEAGKPAFGLFNKDEWKGISDTIGNKLGGRYLLGTAMAGVGLSTSIANIKQGGLGMRPFIVGSSGALVVGATGMMSVKLLDHFHMFTTNSTSTGKNHDK